MKDYLRQLFFPHDDKPQHFPALDGLRGIAILLVLLSHTSARGLLFHEHLDFQRMGKSGVFMFFVLSAYLLDRQIAMALMADKASKRYWMNYFLRRFLRIYPLFFIALLVFFTTNYMGIPTPIKTIKDVGMHLLLLEGKSVFWSIIVEFKYYFLSPLLLLICHKYLKWAPKKLLLYFLVLLLGSIAYGQVAGVHLHAIFRSVPIFWVGTVISIYELLGLKFLEKKGFAILLEILGWLSIALIFLAAPYYFQLIWGFEYNFEGAIWYFPFALLMGFFLLAAKHGQGWLRQLLEFRPLRFLGTISFSLYLFHVPVMIALRRLPLSIPYEDRIFIFFALVIVVSTLSYLLIERPLSKVRIQY